MPASSTLVSLEDVKRWSKRLAKNNPAFTSLSQAQSAVADMLGHASWQALSRFYSQPPTTRQVVPPNSDPLFGPLLDLLNTRYPTLNAQMVEVLAIESEEIDGGIGDIQEKAREYEDQGYFREDALEKAMGDLTVKIHPPPGHTLIRVRDAKNKATLLIVSHEDYKKCMPAPTSQ